MQLTNKDAMPSMLYTPKNTMPCYAIPTLDNHTMQSNINTQPGHTNTRPCDSPSAQQPPISTSPTRAVVRRHHTHLPRRRDPASPSAAPPEPGRVGGLHTTGGDLPPGPGRDTGAGAVAASAVVVVVVVVVVVDVVATAAVTAAPNAAAASASASAPTPWPQSKAASSRHPAKPTGSACSVC